MISFQKRMLPIVIANAALLLIILLALMLAPARRNNRQANLSLYSPADSLERIRLEGAVEVSLVRSGAAWLVESGTDLFPADTTRITAFLEALAKSGQAERVATRREAWADLGLEDDVAVRVSLLAADGSALHAFRVGNYASGSAAIYVALDGKDEAWSVPAGFASYAKGPASSWYDLRLFADLAPQDVQNLELRGSLAMTDGVVVQTDYRLQRWQNGWMLAGNDQVSLNRDKVEALLRAWSGARAQAYAPLDEAPGEALCTLTAWLADGTSRSVSIEGTADGYAATLQPLGKRVYLTAWSIRESIKDLASLLQE
ncbi:MAG: hypothetical protein A2087_05955 [Spirochaetes bacterium GWD1_61_31]|nr:MAG: hypothetical protein A2Y37_13205 [Spirochaetes bacterium GWB1_60_80]OHD35482.1 MAG: hypothetical protein A2004_08520 [Spirochaetes bacterium GWC1_61_12]OHD38271.1 MAG: hypothetical protein A2087_05955 [Spirochaetes bacterium GWD1_61_31]OHD58238.1 MAG: hypothetical protein A2Y32_04920 [Spirochaetes bacterium GWF1_60_12]HAP44296.1 hypothetical protein [Spirochaetaceae bacterium]